MKSYDLAEELKSIDGKFFMEEVRNGFYISSMMKRYWAAQLRTLSEIDKVCKRHGLRWFADCGTLLGAVRHEGFIPWDDDIDISMLRDDLVEFCKYAPDELPESYKILNINTVPNFDYMITNVANSLSICMNPEFMRENFGCPYVTGIDIFPLDALCPDKEKEEERRQQLLEIVDAANHIEAVGTDHPVVKDMLTSLGSRYHYTIHRDKRAQGDLRRLAEKIYMKFPMAEAEKVATMVFWVSDHNHDFPKSAYEETVYLPFEYVHLPAPIGYDEILKGIYGNYMKIYKGGGLHEFPGYAPQERILAKEIGANPYRYTMPKELPESRSVKSDGEVCGEMSAMLTSAHTNIQALVNAGNADAAADLLQGCQNLAISLGTYIEEHVKGGEEAVHVLEEYCERLYEVSEAWNGEESVKLLNDTIKEEEETLSRILEHAHKEVLFIPCRAEWWPSMEREWKHCMDDENCDVTVTPIPYMIRDHYGEQRETFDDSALFPEYVKTTKLEDYDLEARKPDEVYIQAPYDGWNSMFLVPEYYYSENLAKHVKKLVYMPCFEPELPEEPEDKSAKTLKIMAEQPALVYADVVLVKDAASRDAYIEALVQISGEESREYWSAKVRASEAKDVPLQKEEKNDAKKTLVFQVNIAFIKKYGNRALEKVKDALEVIGASGDKLDCVFIPHETLTDGAEEDSEIGKLCRDMLDMVKSSSSIIYDEKHEIVKDLKRISAYYGNPGSLAAKCANAGLPTMIMAVL